MLKGPGVPLRETQRQRGRRQEEGRIEKNKGGARWAGRFWKESEKRFVKNSCHNEWGDTRIFRKFWHIGTIDH